MNLVTWNPFRELEDRNDRFNRPLAGGVLRIEGECKQEKEEKGKRHHLLQLQARDSEQVGLGDDDQLERRVGDEGPSAFDHPLREAP
jgi:hypothetical protein